LIVSKTFSLAHSEFKAYIRGHGEEVIGWLVALGRL